MAIRLDDESRLRAPRPADRLLQREAPEPAIRPPPAPPPAVAPAPPPAERRRRRFSPLTRRILFVNSLALAILVAGLLYVDDYRKSLIEAEFAALRTQAQIIAAALGETAADPIADGRDPDADAGRTERLQPDAVRLALRRLAEPTHTRARVFGLSGELIADTRVLPGPGGQIMVAPLPPYPESRDAWGRIAARLYDLIVDWLPSRETLPPYRERVDQRAQDYDEVVRALQGDTAARLRSGGSETMVLGLAVPVQRFRQVLGALLLSTDGARIEKALRTVRFDIIKAFLFALAITVLLSLYLAGTIARPVRRLALAAERVRRGHGRGGALPGSAPRSAIPDMSARGDEIGDLSLALDEMTRALWQRLDAIERFAADVAHEIKNPLTSLKSAVETAARVKDPQQRERLMAIIVDDVARIDRLLSDIASASRLDAELSRSVSAPVDIARLLRALVDLHDATAGQDSPRLVLDARDAAGSERHSLIVPGIEDRLGQVFRNLIANAVSFSPPGGAIAIAAGRRGEAVEVHIDDDGPGIPEDRLERIFERFYSERPSGEKFGTHSGLGLSISKQIVEAHGGAIRAENRRAADGAVAGARFVIRLPVE